MKLIFNSKYLVLLGGLVFSLTSCFNDLDTIPIDEEISTSDEVYASPDAYRRVLGKVYSGLAVTGQDGAAGNPDIGGIDEGFSDYVRMMWYHQELTTDEAVVGWADATIRDFHDQDWDSQDGFIRGFFARIYFQVAVANEFLRQTTDGRLNERGETPETRAEVALYREEARFLRALSYWHALDHFRNVPFVSEEDEIGAFFPDQITPQTLFDFIESELKAIEGTLLPPRTNEYGRADQAAAWMLLAKLYLNAEVYIGQDRYADALEYTQKVIDSGYQLDPDFGHLFMADNHTADGIIFPVAYDGLFTKTFGGTTFIVHAAIGGDIPAADFGVNGGWGGIRVTSAFVDKFPPINEGSNVIVESSEGNTASYAKLFVPGNYLDPAWAPDNTAVELTSPAGDGVYEGFIFFEAGNEFKVTDGPAWDVNYGVGANEGELAEGGNNFTISEDGVYRVFVDIPNATYTIEKTEWGLIGSATPGGWDADTDMTYDATENALTLTVDLTAEEIKFRANDDWALNFGDDGTDAILERDGANIAIPTPGTYLVKLFLDKPDYTYSVELLSVDGRATFFTEGQDLEISDISQFSDGYAYLKFTNVTSDGTPGSDQVHVDTDFPMFRLADAYLMYAEAVLRGGGGDLATALDLVNQVRNRAYGGAGGAITQDELTLEFILDERSRELAWEGHRRTDLVRFGQFSDGTYLWPWKGGVPDGRTVPNTFDLFPIPANEIGANPKLIQNKGY